MIQGAKFGLILRNRYASHAFIVVVGRYSGKRYVGDRYSWEGCIKMEHGEVLCENMNRNKLIWLKIGTSGGVF
jgi:hypothetical protein